MINEPTSACIAYGLNHSNNTILVLDIGGGTTDISIVRNEDDMIEVLISHGNSLLGGNDITNKLIDFIIKKYKLLNNIDNNLFHIFDKIKIKLSNCEKYTEQINIDDTNIVLDITSNEFINACDDIWKSIEYLIMESLEKSKLTQDNIDYIILVGGSSKIPHIKNIIKKIFHYNKLLDTMNPETIVSEGASILGAIINNTLNKDLVLLDISQFEYSIEDDDNNLIVMIERNMLLPCKITKKFTTTKDYINDIEIKIFQDNLLLGKLELNKLEYEKKGIPVINITFELDVSAMLIVYIEDKKTGSKIMNKFY
jgi:molecular chaperone DnaK